MKTQEQIKRGFVVAAKLISAGVFRVVVVATILFVENASGAGVLSCPTPNPEYLKWQKRTQQTPFSDKPAQSQRKVVRRVAPVGNENIIPRSLEGAEPSFRDFRYLNSLNSREVMGVSGALPRRHDPRENFSLTPVRNQDPQDTGIGTCWAQASVGSMETWLSVHGLENRLFSVRNMVNRIGYDYGVNPAKPSGWFGGTAIKAAAYLLRWSGPVLESDDPYTNTVGVLNYSLTSPELDPRCHVQQMRIVPARTGPLDNENLKRAILEFGGLYATMKLYDPYYTSQGKTYLVPYWNTDGSYYCPESGAGHAVTLIGWDDDYPKENFNSSYRPKGNGAFIVKDSYGTGLPRDEGYIYVSYYDTTFAYTESYAFPQLEDIDNYADIYQYDALGLVDSCVSLSSAEAANIFTAKEDCFLDAIGFYAVVPNERYSLSVHVGCSSGNPTSGTVKLLQTGTVDSYAGYYTVKLDEPVSVKKGQRFSVSMRLNSPALYPIPIELAYDNYSSKATASAGQSFIRINSTDQWLDMTDAIHATANFCCKVYTRSDAASKPTLSSIAISGVSSLTSGERSKFSCEVTYSDGSKKSVDPTWSISEGGAYATISSAGLVTALEVSMQQKAVVKASYTENGVTKESTWGFFVTIAPPAPPTDFFATQGAESSCVRVNWTAPAGATEYAVYRATVNSSANAKYIDRVTVPKYNDTTATPGVDYWYFVKAKNSSGPSGFSEGARGWRALAAPGNVSAGDGASVDFVKVTWDAVEGAACYRVFRAESFDGDSTPLTGWISATEFADSTAEPGTVYWYSVVAATDSAGTRPSAAGIPDDGFRAVPVVPAAIAIEGDGAIPSGGTATYTAFAVYSDGSRGESPLSPAWEVSAGTVSRTGGVTAPTVSANTDLVISAQTTLEGVAISGTKTVAVTATAPGTPSNFRLVSATAGGVSLAWDAVPGASRYVVSRDASGVTADFTTAEATFTDTSAMPGVAYSYRVAAENAAGTGPQSAAVAATIPLSAPTGVKATRDRTDGVRVTWGAVPGATHYRVARAASATGAKTELGAWTADTAYLDTPPATDTAYFYFVKAATDSFGSNPGVWSAGVEGRMKPARTLLSLSVSGPDRVAAGGEAVYSCKASWSDGAEEAVSPAWSVSPASAGSLDANGRFAAASVSSDVGATVTATYGGKTGTASVTVLAPAAATAEITSVTAAQRWPFSGLVDIDYTLATTPAGTKATVSVSAFDEDHGTTLAATALSGDGADGPVAAGTHRLTWNLAADLPGFHASSLRVNVAAAAAEEWTVSFDGNGGSPSVDSMTFTVGAAYGSLPTATRTGYSFDGWFSESDGGAEATVSTRVGKDIAQLHAHWAANTYTIYFDPNGGTGTMPVMAVPYGVTTNLARNAYVRSGWRFDGWATQSGGSAVYADGASVGNLAQTDGASVLLYAVWTRAAPENVTLSSAWRRTEDMSATGTVHAVWSKTNVLTWDAVPEADSYRVYCGTTDDFAQAAQIATTQETTYEHAASTEARYSYWIAAVVGGTRVPSDAVSEKSWMFDLMLLRNVISTIEYINPDGYLADDEINEAINDPGFSDIDGDPMTNSPDELDVYYRIKVLNEDKELIHNVIMGDYSSISTATKAELSDMSDCVKALQNGVATTRPAMPMNLSATQADYGTTKIVLTWSCAGSPVRYEIWRARTKTVPSAETLTKIAEVASGTSYVDTDVSYRVPYSYVVCAVYANGEKRFSKTSAFGYWGDWCFPGTTGIVNLMPLRSLLNVLDGRPNDGVLSDEEMTRAFNNPSIVDIDGNPKTISSDELDILNRIQTLNQNKDLISAVMRGDYTYAGMTYANMVELQAISDKISKIKKT